MESAVRRARRIPAPPPPVWERPRGPGDSGWGAVSSGAGGLLASAGGGRPEQPVHRAGLLSRFAVQVPVVQLHPLLQRLQWAVALCGTRLSTAGGTDPPAVAQPAEPLSPLTFLVRRVTDAPRSMSSLATSKWPQLRASCRGVMPSQPWPPGSSTAAPVVQQEADDVCGVGDVSRLPEPSQALPGAAVPRPGLTQVPVVAGLVQGRPATVVPRVQWVALRPRTVGRSLPRPRGLASPPLGALRPEEGQAPGCRAQSRSHGCSHSLTWPRSHPREGDAPPLPQADSLAGPPRDGAGTQ